MDGTSTAFVAGATGYTGREVVRLLRAQNVRTLAHVRPESPRLFAYQDLFHKLGAEVDSTAWQAEAMEETLRRSRPDIVFALLGITKARARQEAKAGAAEPSYDTVDYGLTALLLQASRACGSSPRFVYLSAAGVGPKAAGAYYRARWKAERAIIESGLSYVIARPSFITGPDRDDRRPFERVGANVADAALAVSGWLGARRLRDRYRSTTNTVLAQALVRHGLERGAPSRILESEELR